MTKNLFESEENLMNTGYILAGDVLINVKKKSTFARCQHCDFFSELPFQTINKVSKKVIWTCVRCKTDSFYFVNQNIIQMPK